MHNESFTSSLCLCWLQALHYLILISEVEETEIFKICLEYWNYLAGSLYREHPFNAHSPLLLTKPHTDVSSNVMRRHLYNPILSKVCVVLIFSDLLIHLGYLATWFCMILQY